MRAKKKKKAGEGRELPLAPFQLFAPPRAYPALLSLDVKEAVSTATPSTIPQIPMFTCF